MFKLKLFCIYVVVVHFASSFNIDGREFATTVFDLNFNKKKEGASDYAGYNFVASVTSNQIRVVAGAPSHQSVGGDSNGVLIECEGTLHDPSKYSGASSNWISNVTCHNALNDSSLTIKKNQQRVRDLLGATLLEEANPRANQYTVCAPGREKRCGSSGTYVPGACYSGSLPGGFLQLEGWGEIGCFETYLDVVFLIDSSHSINQSDFDLIKQILINTTAAFADSLGESTQIGILQYGILDVSRLNYTEDNQDHYVNPTKLGDCDDISCLKRAILDNMTHLKSGATYTAHAILRAVEVDFKRSKNHQVAKKILVLITDGSATDSEVLTNSYDVSQANNVTVYAIGVGSEVNVDQLKISANGGESEEQVLTPENYGALSRQLENITEEISRISAEGSGDIGNTLEFAQFGFSGHRTATNESFLGAVGAYYWTGTVIKHEFSSSQTFQALNITVIQLLLGNKSEDSYLGYAISSGYYEGGEDLYVAVSAPKFQFRGAVLIFKNSKTLSIGGGTRILPKCGGPTCSSDDDEAPHFLGSYFGGSLLSVDVNGDHKTDLLVGSPLYTGASYDEGRVFVYVSTQRKSLEMWSDPSHFPNVMTGDDVGGGRFGSAMVAAGDLNGDGYNDVIIGAPYADGGRGAIFVYHGGAAGLRNQAAQKISASDFMASEIYSFGYFLQGGLDVDQNKYPDVFVGAPQSGFILILRTRPIVAIHASLRFNPRIVDVLSCFDQPIRDCLILTACFEANGTSLEGSITLDYVITLDHHRQRLEFRGENGSFHSTNEEKGNIFLPKMKNMCRTFNVFVKMNVKDLSSPLEAVMSYELSAAHLSKQLSPVARPNQPHLASATANFHEDCGSDGVCEHELILSAGLQLPEGIVQKPNGEEVDFSEGGGKLLVAAGTIKQPIKVVIHLTNSGDVAYGSKVIVTYPSVLSWIQVSNISSSNSGSSDCVMEEQELVNGSYKSRILVYSYNHFLGNIFPIEAWCFFKCEFSLGHLGIRTTVPNISIHLEARAENGRNHPQNTNNKKTFNIPVEYKADVRVTRVSEESLVTLDPTNKESPETTDKNPNITQQFQVENLGFSRISNSSISLRYPSLLKQLLLCLDQVSCTSLVGNSQCSCVGTSEHRCGQSTVEQEFLRKLLDCSSSNQSASFCNTIICDVTNFAHGDVIQLTASFELSAATFLFDENNTEVVLRSQFEFTSRKSPHIVGPFGSRPIVRRTKIDVTVEQRIVVTPPEAPSLIVYYIVGGNGGLGLLLLVTIILYKCKFFKRESYKLHQNPSKYETIEGRNDIFENVETEVAS